MTAPGDPIALFQGGELLDICHGADPDGLSGVVRLETGLVKAGDATSGILQGQSSHSDVINPGTTAFNNILGVMTGGDVSLYVASEEFFDETYAGEGVPYLYPMENPDDRPPTMDVP